MHHAGCLLIFSGLKNRLSYIRKILNNIDLDKEVKRLVHQNRYKNGYVCTVDIFLQLCPINQHIKNILLKNEKTLPGLIC